MPKGLTITIIVVIVIALIIGIVFLMKSKGVQSRFGPEVAGKFVPGYPASGRLTFPLVVDAMGKCLEVADCGGLTREGDQWTLRSGTVLMDSPSGESSHLRL